VNEAEFAVLVNDHWQNQGLGYELLKQLIEVGRAEKLDRIVGEVLSENQAMRHICKKLGFKIFADEDNRTYTATYKF
jgi:acetyltransferase